MYIDELTIALYAWDLADEGVDYILDTVQEKAGCNAVYITALMHHEKRPHLGTFFPHNPVRKHYLPEDSRIYWLPDPKHYADSRIKPRSTERDFLKGTDWINVLSDAARKRNMRPQVAISHTPLDKQRAAEEFSDCVQQDIYGRRFGQQLCWNNPDAQQYIYCLISDLVANHDIDTFQISNLLFNEGKRDLHPFLGVTLGGCFCKACEKKARGAGLDWDNITKTVKHYADVLNSKQGLVFYKSLVLSETRLSLEKGNSSPVKFLLEHPELYEWLRFRCESITAHFKIMHETIETANSKVKFRFNSCWPVPEYIGQQLKDLKPYLDAVRLMDYTEQWGDPALMSQKAQWLTNARRELGEGFPLNAAIALRLKANPEMIYEAIRVSVESSADSLSLAFWDTATMEQLTAVKKGMERAEVKLRAPNEAGYVNEVAEVQHLETLQKKQG